MLWKIDWRIVQRMLVDAPNYSENENSEGDQNTVLNLTEQTSEDFEAQLKNIFG